MDYEKKYNEALEVAKKNLEAIDTQAEGCTFSGVGFKNTLIHCFPELAESEDEKIRKDIIEYFKDKRVDDGIQPMLESWIAWLEKQSPSAYELGHAEGMRVKNKEWLEKQGEQKDFGMKSAEESLGVSSETYNKIVDECIYGEHKHVEWSEEQLETLNTVNVAGGLRYVGQEGALISLYKDLKAL